MRAYLELKHHFDSGEDDPDLRPSDAAKAKLRSAVAAHIAQPQPVARAAPFAFMRAPVPLYGTLAAAAIAAIVALALPRLLATPTTHALVEGPQVDTSREVPISAELY